MPFRYTRVLVLAMLLTAGPVVANRAEPKPGHQPAGNADTEPLPWEQGESLGPLFSLGDPAAKTVIHAYVNYLPIHVAAHFTSPEACRLRHEFNAKHGDADSIWGSELCGSFQELQRRYLDTGKAYLLVHEFVLNPSLEADVGSAMVGRCVPPQEAAEFFRLQAERYLPWELRQRGLGWPEQRAKLIEIARSVAPNRDFDRCLAPELKAKLFEATRQASREYDVYAVPSYRIEGRRGMLNAIELLEQLGSSESR